METNKNLPLFLTLVIWVFISCQPFLVRQSPYQSITLDMADSLVTLQITQTKLTPRLDKTYFWFDRNQIQVTQGAYSGHLLDGAYKVTSPDGTLRTVGQFRNGLQVGIWKFYSGNTLVRTLDKGKEEPEESTKRSFFSLNRKDTLTQDTSRVRSIFRPTE